MKLYIILLALLFSLAIPIESQDLEGRIFIDTGHSSQDIEKIFSKLTKVLEANNYYVHFGKSFPHLELYDVLVIAIPTNPFTVDEINSIHSFVKNGGGLLLLGESGPLTVENVKDFNLLAMHYNIEFQRDVVIDTQNNITLDKPYPEIPIIVNFAEHPITKNVKKIFFSSGCSLRLSGKARSLAWGSNETYGDRLSEAFGYRGGSYDPALEKKGEELIFMAYTESGKGKVVALGDTSLFRGRASASLFWPDDPLNYFDHKKLALNIFHWLSFKIREKKTLELINESIIEARYLIVQGRYEEASDLLNLAKSMSVEIGDSTSMREIVLLTLEANKGAQADKLLEEGKTYAENLKCEEALKSLEQALSLYESVGNEKKIEECLKLLSECGNKSVTLQKADLLISEGKRLFRQKKYSEAVDTVKEAKTLYESVGRDEKVKECSVLIEEIQDYEQKERQNIENMKRNRMILTGILLGTVIMITIFLFMKKIKYRP
jgi:tetratricopeptide (TPR) repeat protein